MQEINTTLEVDNWGSEVEPVESESCGRKWLRLENPDHVVDLGDEDGTLLIHTYTNVTHEGDDLEVIGYMSVYSPEAGQKIIDHIKEVMGL
ncbi:hypothetical protein CN1A_23 [Clavibacter phage CN1A]|uniref:Uncharacterized protein n=1 Tax=Clavibacter phage CN1A TaxID=1406793 RepID=U5PX24_9CAUD|nr:hypothetical protein CN1A_23 [Clavibacter phage CN1A]AGY47132.1 hypothetical protein CN1A_23 [Clavibacter phage CN1A]